jgi:polar amino acid transport system substrate-binding protein
MKMKKGRISAVFLAAGLAISGCSNGTSTEAAAPSSAPAEAECVPAHPGLTTVIEGQLTIAAYEYAPFSGIEGDKVTGAEGEILNAIAALECLTAVAQPGAAAAMIPAVETGRADTTFGSWYRTAERAKIVQLSDPVIIDQLTLISVEGVDSIAGLEGKKVGSTLGFLWNDDLEKILGNDLSLYETTQALYADLASGRISVVVDTFPSGTAALKNNPIEGAQFKVPAPDERVVATTLPGQTNFPVSLSNPDLGKAINDNLETLRNSGELAKIVEKWGFSPSSVDKTEPNLL